MISGLPAALSAVLRFRLTLDGGFFVLWRLPYLARLCPETPIKTVMTGTTAASRDIGALIISDYLPKLRLSALPSCLYRYSSRQVPTLTNEPQRWRALVDCEN